MIYSRFFVVICVGILIPSFVGVISFYLPVFNNILGVLLNLLLTYGVIGLLSIWSSERYPYVAASFSAIIVCVFQYSFTIFFIEGDMVFVPNVFALSLGIAILISNAFAWLFFRKRRGNSEIKT